MTDPQSQLFQLTIDQNGAAAAVHFFLVWDLSEVADYVRNAVALFYREHPEATLASGITFTIAKGKLPEVSPDPGITPKYFDGADLNDRLRGILDWKPGDT